MSKLSYGDRQRLSASKFAVPETRQLPINDRSHAINATARLNQTFLSPKYMAEARRRLKAARKHFHLKDLPL